MNTHKTVRDYIRTIPDFPHAGIMFRDVTTLFADARGFRIAIDQLLHPYAGQKIDKVAGLEARGFILGGAVAHQLGVAEQHSEREAVAALGLYTLGEPELDWPSPMTTLRDEMARREWDS